MRFERGKRVAEWALTKGLKHRLSRPVVLPLYRRFPKPFNAQVAVTTRCQCACSHCSAEMYKREGWADPTTAQLRTVIDQLGRTRAYKVYFFGGEPLLRDDIVELVAYASQRGFQTSMDSNGERLDPAMVAALAGAGLTEIGVSLDAADPARHDTFRGVPGLHAKAVAGLEACRQHGIATYVSSYASKESLGSGELAAVCELGLGLGAKVRIISPVAAGKWLGEESIKLDEQDVRRLRALLREGRVYWESVTCSSADAPFVCFSSVKGYVYISARGDVQACNFIPVSFGNLHEEPLFRILRRMWASEFFRGIDHAKNPSGCAMNEAGLQGRIQAAIHQGASVPVDYRML